MVVQTFFLKSLLSVLEFVRSGTFLFVFILSPLSLHYSIVMTLYNVCYGVTPLVFFRAYLINLNILGLYCSYGLKLFILL